MSCWTIHLPGGPGRRNRAAVAVEHEVYCFVGGGLCCKEKTLLCVHVFNTLSLRWRKLPPVTPGRGEHQPEVPSRRLGHTAVLIEDTVYLWGGCPDYDGLYAFDVDTHRWLKPKVSGTVPEGKANHSACVLEKVMYIHGGWTWTTNDIYKLDTTSMVWSLVNTIGPPAPCSEYHSATIIGTKMFVFGGYYRYFRSIYRYYNIRVFDTETNCWLNTPSFESPCPVKRPRGHSAFTYNGELYIQGGNTNVNDLWKENPETFCRKKVELKGKGPSPVVNMSCVLVGDRVVLFADNDLFILDLSSSLKNLCKLAVIQYGLVQSELPHNIRWELAAMTTKRKRRREYLC